MLQMLMSVNADIQVVSFSNSLWKKPADWNLTCTFSTVPLKIEVWLKKVHIEEKATS